MNYFVLRALATEWNDLFRGGQILDVWSQSANEQSIGLKKDGDEHTVRIHCDPKLPLLFRSPGYGRAKRNSASLFDGLAGKRVVSIYCAERDRFVFVELEGGAVLQIQLFGSRPNVFWVQDGRIRESFLLNENWKGKGAPASRPAPIVDSLDEFTRRWPLNRKTVVQALSAAIPLFDRQLAKETVFRVGLDPLGPPQDVGFDAIGQLFHTVSELDAELESSKPVVYWRDPFVEAFSLIQLDSVNEEWREERFDTADAALGVFSKRKLAQRRFDDVFKPIESALVKAHRKHSRSAEAMLSELEKPSRADKYEMWGHLLMAQATNLESGQDTITLPNIMGDGADVKITLDQALSGIENAQRYYEKARKTREARRHAESRWKGVQAQSGDAGSLLEELRTLTKYAEVEAYLKSNKLELAQFARPGAVGEVQLPFRQYKIEGWEIRVGKNAKSNAALTTKHSGPHDLWLHARGVPGSHVVIRRPGKIAEVPKAVIEAAAQIAAHFSDAKSQQLAPVIVTERKYVRPIKGGPLGLVRVDREDVVMVEPGLPT